MALTLNALVSGAMFGDGTKLWRYQSADSIATIAGANYFDTAATRLKVGDIMHVVSTAESGGGFKSYFVSAISAGGAVTIVAQIDATA